MALVFVGWKGRGRQTLVLSFSYRYHKEYYMDDQWAIFFFVWVIFQQVLKCTIHTHTHTHAQIIKSYLHSSDIFRYLMPQPILIYVLLVVRTSTKASWSKDESTFWDGRSTRMSSYQMWYVPQSVAIVWSVYTWCLCSHIDVPKQACCEGVSGVSLFAWLSAAWMKTLHESTKQSRLWAEWSEAYFLVIHWDVWRDL